MFVGLSHASVLRVRDSLPEIVRPFTYSKTVCPKATKFGMVAHVAQQRISGVSDAPSSEEAAPRSTHFFRYIHVGVVSEATRKFCMVMRSYVRKNFTPPTMNADTRSVCGS